MRLKRLALVAVLVLGGSIGWPAFKKFAARAKQGECHSYLRMLGEWEQAYFAKHGEFTESAEALGAGPQQTYAFVIGHTVLVPTLAGKKDGLVERIPPSIRQTLHVDRTSFTLACVADLDDDELADVWTVSSEPRPFGERVVEAGRVFQHLDDVDDDSTGRF